MAKVISVLSQKGGSGKTTISTNLAVAMSRMGHKVLLVDSDVQGSARDWVSANESPEVELIVLDRPGLLNNLKSISSSYDFILIDGSAKVDMITTDAVVVSDLVLMTVQPSPYDIWASAELIDLVQKRKALTDGKLLSAFVISRAIPNTNLSKEVGQALEGYDLPIINGTTQKTAYAVAASEGKSVFTLDAKSKASLEVQALAESVLQMIN